MTVSVDLSGRSAIVTGGGGGIGRATALLLARAGAACTIADIDENGAGTTADEIRAAGGRAAAIRTDVTRAEEALDLARSALEAYGRIDILVNNAASWSIKLFKQTAPEDWEADIRVTLFGTLNCSRAVTDAMIGQRYGRIVNLISEAGRIGEPYLAAYSAAKGGVAAFTKALARELGRYGVTVNGVSPGVTHTPGSADYIGRAGGEEKLAKAYPLRRLGQPIDIANAILFLASDLSPFITGQILSVSGGYSMVG